MYALLCDYAADKDHCWPSQATLAKRLSCSISSIKNYLAELVMEKLIYIKREQYRSSVYYLLYPDEISDNTETRFADRQSENGSDRTKSGYLTNLNKQRKEKDSPLPPVAPGQTTASPNRRSFRTPAAGGVSLSLQGFESTWALYPKKDAKGFARLAWLQLLRSGQLPPLDEIRAAIRRFADSESWQREQGRFVPQMGNWLRGQRWLDPLPPAEQRHGLELRQAAQAWEEQERRVQEQQRAEKERLRPLFDAFAAKFPPSSNNAMSFGMWLHLHSQNLAPSASDVPPANAVGIVEFMNNFKRQAQTAVYRETHGISQASRPDPRTSDCRPLGEILKTLPSVARFFQAGNGSGWPLESPVTVCA